MGVGRVAGAASTQVTPESSRDYTWIVDDGGSVQFAATHIEIQGQKGVDAFPDPDDFKQGLKSFRKNVHYLDFVQEIARFSKINLRFEYVAYIFRKTAISSSSLTGSNVPV